MYLRRSPVRSLTLLAVAMLGLGAAHGADHEDDRPGPPDRPVRPYVPPVVNLGMAELAEDSLEASRRNPLAFPVTGRFDYGIAENRFGDQRYGHVHQGQDIFAMRRTPLVAVRDGEVIQRGNGGGRGNFVVIYNFHTKRSYHYFHMHKQARVRRGQIVYAGQRVGELGCTGSCQGDHLHFEIHLGRSPRARAINPRPFLTRAFRRSVRERRIKETNYKRTRAWRF